MRLFVTGTDTGVGKTEVSAALLSLMVARGLKPFAFKPYESGDTGDSDALWAAAGKWQPRAQVCVHRFDEPLAPAIAAARAGRKAPYTAVLRAFSRLGKGPGVVEGAGGLHVPLDRRHEVIDLIEALGLPVLLVARAGLGTLNHTQLSLEALARRRVRVHGVVLVQTTPDADLSVKTNRAWLAASNPKIEFVGPLPYLRNAAARRLTIQRALLKSLSFEK